MLVGLPPFYSKDRDKLYQNIKYGDPRMDYEFLSPDARDLCTRLLIKNPLERLGSGEGDAEDIKCHPWFECIDWKKIESKVLAPPYKPQLDSPLDVKHFPPDFTSLKPSPQDLESLKASSASKIPGFSYENTDEFAMQNNYN